MPAGLRGAHVAAGDDADAERLGLRHGAARLGLERAVLRARDREVAAFAAEDAERTVEPWLEAGRARGTLPLHGSPAAASCSLPRSAGCSADQRDQAGGVGFDLVPGDAGLAFGRVALRDGQEPGEVAVALARFDQELERATGDVRELGADDGAKAGLAGRAVEARDPVEPVAIGEREGRMAELGRALGQILGVAGPVQEREGAARTQLDVSRRTLAGSTGGGCRPSR